jgi:hypothetical protein
MLLARKRMRARGSRTAATPVARRNKVSESFTPA